MKPSAPGWLHLVRSATMAWAVAGIAAAQTGVRLVKVPDVVQLPAQPGSNLLLEAEVDGGATDVWLATDAAARDRVALTAVAAGRWQVNLADPRVAALLPSGRDGGALFVFATIAAATKQSIAVVWSRRAIDDGKVRCVLRASDGGSTTLAPGAAAWIELDRVDRFEVHGAGARQSAVVARAGGLQLPLRRVSADELWVLASDRTLHERLADARTLAIEARLGGELAVFSFRLVPRTLELPNGEARFQVSQRGSGPVPGSDGWLTVQIDDITMGHTRLRVANARGAAVVETQPMYDGDFVALTLAGERYVLVVERLVNKLVGTDHAVLHVRPAAGFQPDRVAQLLRAVGDSTEAFVFDGSDLGAAMTKQLLVAMVGSRKAGRPTVEQFFVMLDDENASVDGRTHGITVRGPDGTTVPLPQWLRARLRTLEAEDAAAKPATDPKTGKTGDTQPPK